METSENKTFPSMKYWKNPASIQKIKNFLHKGSILLFDYDGTLSPIVKNPHAAKVPKTSLKYLKRLQKNHPIFVLTGRSVRDTQMRLPNEFHNNILGNHGIESSFLSNKLKKKLPVIVDQWHLAFSDLSIRGLYIENKKLSLSIHYRRSANKKKAQELIQKTIDSLSPKPRVFHGKEIYNLLPNINWNKGTVSKKILKQYSNQKAIFIGDDVNDEDVFEIKSSYLLGIRVGRSKKSKAQIYLKNQKEMSSFLEYLIEMHSRA
jgi:trehalose-phosphatase